MLSENLSRSQQDRVLRVEPGDLQLSISNTQRTTVEATTVTSLVCNSGSNLWIASWYKAKLIDSGKDPSFLSSCLALSASME